MGDEIALKKKRTSAKQKFTRTINQLRPLLSDAECNGDELKQVFEELTHAWERLEERHEEYIEALEGEHIEDEEWINAEQQRYSDLRKEYYMSKKRHEKFDKLSRAKWSRNIHDNAFGAQCQIINKLIADNATKESLLREKSALESKFEALNSGNMDVSLQLDVESEDSWMTHKYDEYMKIMNSVDDYIRISTESSSKSRFCMEKIALPMFDGNIRNYPRFIKDFKNLILPSVNIDESAFTLRQCLASNVRMYLGNEDDLNSMLKLLDTRYGDPGKLIESIIGEVQMFRKIEESDFKKLIRFVDVLDTGYRDLKNLGLEREISNAHVVSIIENKLPKSLELDWYRQIHKKDSPVDKRNKFPHLLEFLEVERSALEYGTSDLKPPPHKYVNVNSLDSSISAINCLLHTDTNHATEDCRQYKRMSISNRYSMLRDLRACFGCLQIGHQLMHCQCRVICSDGCGKFHHKSLHEQRISDATHPVSNIAEADSSFCLLPIMKVDISSPFCHSLNTLWDSGASITLITNSKANLLKLDSKPIQLSVIKVGGIEERIMSREYVVPLITKSRKRVFVRAYGIDKITSKISSLSLDYIVPLFRNVTMSDIERPEGEVDLLIGYEYAGLHPIPKESNGNLLLLSNEFGKCVAGSHPTLTEGIEHSIMPNLTTIVNFLRASVVDDFFSLEALGVECSPRCGNCMCRKCPLGGKLYTIKEERELNLIKENLKFENNCWVATYPWKQSPGLLPNNYAYALKALISTEKRLARDDKVKSTYMGEVDDMFDRNVARKLSVDEIHSYNGPVHYVAHHAVSKPESKSTPVRIVFNSSHNYRGHTLNDYWAKGPNAFMNNIFGILIRFRENYVGFVGDIKKMYNSVHISEIDQHCHRFLWRSMETHREPDINVLTTVTMGDRPGGTLATVAMYKTAEMAEERFPYEAKIIKGSSYVDDIVDCAGNQEAAEEITANITGILKTGNFHIKEWIISGSHIKSYKIESGEIERVLGVLWNPHDDCFYFNVSLRFPKTDKEGDDASGVPLDLTKRMVLSHLNGIFDPIGLLAPFIVKGKILMRDLWVHKYDWDTPLSSDLRSKWLTFFLEMKSVAELRFNRCIKPSGVRDDPVLIIFSDASKQAYGTCAYIRWELQDGTFVSNLLASKSRVAPLRTETIVRLELAGAILNKRLRISIEHYSRIKFKQVFHIIDSEVVRAMLQKESYGFNTFVATRIGEIQNATNISDWYWVRSELNIADMITKGENPLKLDSCSEWQRGPSFLALSIDQWPIRNDNSVRELPERVKPILLINKLEPEIIDIERFSSYDRLIRTTARILKLKEPLLKYSFSAIGGEITGDCIMRAVLFWCRLCQLILREDLEKGTTGKGRFKNLNICKRDDGLYILKGRTELWNEISYNEDVIILPNEHRFSKLYAEQVHNNGHMGVHTCVAKVRAKYWIPGIVQMMKAIRFKCIICRKHFKKLSAQIMAPLPIERLKPSPPWYTTGLDLFGPFHVKGEVNKRSSGKGYGIIFTCLVTRAAYIDLATDYSTDGFLLVFRRFVSVHGYPNKIYSDQGSQLTAASKELATMFNCFDWDKIKGSVKFGIDWKFSPAEAPWYNGCCESLISSIKKCLRVTVGDQKLYYSELQTLLFEVATLLNERPIGVVPCTGEDTTYLCPNDCLLGRTTIKAPCGDFDLTSNSKKRIWFVQRMTDMFWKKWTTFYFSSLIIRKKWHHEHRNLAVNDIVSIYEKDLPRGHWKLGEITKVFYSSDDKVRHVSLRYKNPNSQSFIEIERPVQKLIVIMPVEEREDLH